MSTSNLTPVSDDLQRLVSMGFHVFPVDHPGLKNCLAAHLNGPCDGQRGKHPVGQWSKDAENSTRRFHKGRCLRNTGIACGPSNLVVVDEDSTGHLMALLSTLGQELPPTFTVRTGRGHHHYFRQLDDGRERLANSNLKNLSADIDIRADGGYVVGPGSVHQSGEVYEALDWSVSVATLPEWLYDFLIERAHSVPDLRSGLGAGSRIEQPSAAGSMQDAIEILDKWRINAQGGKRASLRSEFDGSSIGGSDSEHLWHLECGLFDLGLEVEEVFTVATHAACARKYLLRTGGVWDDVMRAYSAPRSCNKAGASAQMNSGMASVARGGRRRLRVIRGDQVVAQKVTWVWKDENGMGRLPAGELSIVSGKGNVGKSPFTLWLAAQISVGKMPGDWEGEPGNILIYASEDSIAHTIVPRLKAAGADMARVGFLQGTISEDDDSDMPLDWELDLPEIVGEMDESEVRLLIIDPLLSVTTGDANSTSDMRKSLDRLVTAAHHTGAVIMGITHFNKSGGGGDANNAQSGAAVFRDAPRSVFHFAEDKSSGTRVLSQDKNNLGRMEGLISYTYDMQSVEVLVSGEYESYPAFRFTGQSDVSVDDILKQAKQTGGGVGGAGSSGSGLDGDGSFNSSGSRLDDAVQWLTSYFEELEPHEQFGVPAAMRQDIISDAAKAKYPQATLDRARNKMGCIKSEKVIGGMKNQQYWVYRPLKISIKGVPVAGGC